MTRMMLKKVLSKMIPLTIYFRIVDLLGGFVKKSYSQEGEDLLLSKILENSTSNGFYIDVGAHHPKRFSNTYLFYRSGWRGINIDAMPGSMELFQRQRPRDINLEVPISDKEEVLKYYAFFEPALNTLSKELGEFRASDKKTPLKFVRELRTTTLEALLDQYLPTAQKIDFLTVDVEGLDLQVLKSNNWQKYAPLIVVVEAYEQGLENLMNSEVYRYLFDLGYELIAKTPNTVIYKLSIMNRR